MKTRNTLLLGICVLLLLSMAVYAYSTSVRPQPQKSSKLDGSACTMDYNPVCGSDGITYGNMCMAGKIEIAHAGECNPQVNPAGGTYSAGSDIPNITDEELAAS